MQPDSQALVIREHPLAARISLGLLTLSLLIAVHFYGVGVNLLFLWLATLLPILLYVGRGPKAVGQALATSPWLLGSAYLSLGLIGVSHNFFSLSYDTSFAASWIIAALPLLIICACLSDPDKLFRLAAWMVFVFAAISAYEFAAHGQRAHTPLFDPNNYVTLLYLSWIPWVLCRHAKVASRRDLAVTFVVSICVCVSMFATYSRFAMAVAVGMCGLTSYNAWRFDLNRKYAMLVVVAVAFGFALFAGLDPRGLDQAFDDGVEPEQVVSVDARGLMLGSTYDSIRSHGGVNGTGLFTFSLLYPQSRSSLEQVTTGHFVHNDYVQLGLEGGVWLLLPMMVLFVAVGYRCIRGIFFSKQWDPHIGYLSAVGVALAHAMVNFVFYVLPLTVMLGIAIACGFARPDSQVEPRKLDRVTGVLLWLLVSAGLVWSSFLLGLDTLTYGVFSAQNHVPTASLIRQDNADMLSYARTAQAINPHRGIPVLGEARLMDVQLRPAASALLVDDVNAAYFRAIEVDPWNPLVFTSYYNFLQRHPQQLGSNPYANVPYLLARPRELNPTGLRSIGQNIDHYISHNKPLEALGVVGELLNWCELLARRRGAELKPMLLRLQASKLLAEHDSGNLRQRLTGCLSHSAYGDSDGREAPALMRWLRDG